MKKIKLLLMISIIFLLCGCEANYDLYIGKNSFKEETTILADNSELSVYDLTLHLTTKQKIDMYYKGYVDIIYQNPYYNPYLNDPQDGITYYEKELINNGKNYGIKYKYNFTQDNYVNSNIINSFFKNKKSVLSDNKYILNVNTFNGFERYNDLKKVTINITTNFDVKKNNADSVSGNTYTWFITKDNAINKSIYMELLDIKSEKETSQQESKKKTLIILGVACLLIVVGYFLYHIYKYKLVKNDSI